MRCADAVGWRWRWRVGIAGSPLEQCAVASASHTQHTTTTHMTQHTETQYHTLPVRSTYVPRRPTDPPSTQTQTQTRRAERHIHSSHNKPHTIHGTQTPIPKPHMMYDICFLRATCGVKHTDTHICMYRRKNHEHVLDRVGDLGGGGADGGRLSSAGMPRVRQCSASVGCHEPV